MHDVCFSWEQTPQSAYVIHLQMLETVLAPSAASFLHVPLPHTSQDKLTSRSNIQGPDRKSTPDGAPTFSGIITDVRCSIVSSKSQDRCRTNMQSCQPPGFWSACLHEKFKTSLCLLGTDFGVFDWYKSVDRVWGRLYLGAKKNLSALLKGLKVPKWNHLLVILRHQKAERGRRIWRFSHVYTVHPDKNAFLLSRRAHLATC